MKIVTLKLTTEELALLTTLVADQLFRKEFIDPKMPGYKSNAGEMSLGKALMGRLRFMLDPASAKKATSPSKRLVEPDVRPPAEMKPPRAASLPAGTRSSRGAKAGGSETAARLG